MTDAFIPIPVLLGETFRSTLAVMLFPDDPSKARTWHATELSKGTLQAYLEAGHSFDDRLPDFLNAVGGANVGSREPGTRFAGAMLAADVFKVLWAQICQDDEGASWASAIAHVCDSTSAKEAGSQSHIRKQLRRFAPVLHLWLGWQLAEHPCREQEFFDIGYPILFAARAWAAARPTSFAESYLSVQEYGPWPELAKDMHQHGGSRLRLISLRQPLQKTL